MDSTPPEDQLYNETRKSCPPSQAPPCAVEMIDAGNHGGREQGSGILETLCEPFLALDDEMVITFCNVAAARELGRRKEDVEGKALFDVFSEERHTVFEMKCEEAKRTRQAVCMEGYFFCPPYQKWFEVWVSPRDKGLAVYFLHRIGARGEVVVEAQWRASQLQECESLNRMARAVAHHFNNQLQVVTGNLELALATPPHGAMWSAQCLADALQAARRTAEVNGGLLTYLGSTRGKQEPMDFAEVCRSSLPVLTAAMPGKVTVEADLPAPGPIVKTNAALVCQMLTQLVTNAAEAMENRPGAVRLRVGTIAPEEVPAGRRFPIDAAPPTGPCAFLEVTESGCGIAEEDLKDLFDPYYSSKFPGRGMGLALVLGIVRVHEGAIAVESEPGRGSTFRVYLPLAAEAVARPPEKGKLTGVVGGGTVLLAEDDRSVRAVTAKMLANMGFKVIQAVDGAEAVELFAKHKDEIRWVLSDVRMPRMDGWEVLATVRKLCPGVPVVLATGYDPAFMDADHHPDQPQVVLSKPYGVAELQKAIQKVIAEGKADMLKGKRGRDTDCEKG